MAVKRTGLGRGLDALIRDPKAKDSSADKAESKTVKSTTKKNTKSTENKEKTVKSTKKSAEKADKSENTASKAAPKSVTKTTAKANSKSSAKPAAQIVKEQAKLAEKKPVEVKKITQPEKKEATAKKNDLPDSGEATVRISLVEPNREQPRKTFVDESVSELADSIRQFGVITPLIVQKKEDHYEIIAGERRWRAAKEAGLKEVPVLIRDYNSQEAAEIALIENIQREDLNAIEEASAYKRLMDDFDLNQEEVAKKVSKSRAAVANSMRLLKLDSRVQEMVKENKISEGHARALLGILDSDEQFNLAQQIVKNHLSVRQTEQMVKNYGKAAATVKKKADPQWEAVISALSDKLKDVLGTKVAINQKTKKKGVIEIEYYSNEDLERIYEMLLNAKN